MGVVVDILLIYFLSKTISYVYSIFIYVYVYLYIYIYVYTTQNIRSSNYRIICFKSIFWAVFEWLKLESIGCLQICDKAHSVGSLES